MAGPEPPKAGPGSEDQVDALVEAYRSIEHLPLPEDAKQVAALKAFEKLDQIPPDQIALHRSAKLRAIDLYRRDRGVIRRRCPACCPGTQLDCGTCNGQGYVRTSRVEPMGGGPDDQAQTSELERPPASGEPDPVPTEAVSRLEFTEAADLVLMAHQELLTHRVRADGLATKAVSLEVLRQVAAGVTGPEEVFGGEAPRGRDRDTPLAEIVEAVWLVYDPGFAQRSDDARKQAIHRASMKITTTVRSVTPEVQP